MTLVAALTVIWLIAGVQVLLFMTWILVSHRLPLKLTWRGGFFTVVFWPDILADLIGFMRAGRRPPEDDDERR